MRSPHRRPYWFYSCAIFLPYSHFLPFSYRFYCVLPFFYQILLVLKRFAIFTILRHVCMGRRGGGRREPVPDGRLGGEISLQSQQIGRRSLVYPLHPEMNQRRGNRIDPPKTPNLCSSDIQRRIFPNLEGGCKGLFMLIGYF